MIAALKLVPVWTWGVVVLVNALCAGSFATAWFWHICLAFISDFIHGNRHMSGSSAVVIFRPVRDGVISFKGA